MWLNPMQDLSSSCFPAGETRDASDVMAIGNSRTWLSSLFVNFTKWPFIAAGVRSRREYLAVGVLQHHAVVCPSGRWLQDCSPGPYKTIHLCTLRVLVLDLPWLPWGGGHQVVLALCTQHCRLPCLPVSPSVFCCVFFFFFFFFFSFFFFFFFFTSCPLCFTSFSVFCSPSFCSFFRSFSNLVVLFLSVFVCWLVAFL